MFEICNGRDEMKFAVPYPADAESFFQAFSQPGDYVWDTNTQTMTMANVEAINV